MWVAEVVREGKWTQAARGIAGRANALHLVCLHFYIAAIKESAICHCTVFFLRLESKFFFFSLLHLRLSLSLSLSINQATKVQSPLTSRNIQCTMIIVQDNVYTRLTAVFPGPPG